MVTDNRSANHGVAKMGKILGTENVDTTPFYMISDGVGYQRSFFTSTKDPYCPVFLS